MSQPTRRSTRTRKTPQRFSEETFQNKKTTESKQVNNSDNVSSFNCQGVDGQEYYEEYDGQGRLWEINLLTGEGTLLYDPSQFSEDTTQTGVQETKEPDTTVTKHALIFNFRSKQLARRLYQRPFQITENHTLVCPLELKTTRDLDNLIESHGGSIIYYLNKAINYYKEEVSGTDKFKQFKDKNLFVLDEITIRESYFTPEGKECGEDKTFYPEWGQKKMLMLYGALMFDGVTFHFYRESADADPVKQEGPQLVITEKQNERKQDERRVKTPKEKKVTFNLPPKKHPSYREQVEGDRDVFKKAVETPLPSKSDIVAAETLLTISDIEKMHGKKTRKKEKKRDKEKKKRDKEARKKKKEKKKLKKRLDKLFTPIGYNIDCGEGSGSHLYRQTYQKFNVFSDKPVSAEQQLFTDTLVSPLTTLAHLWTSTNYQLYCDEYMVFKYTNLSNGTSNVLAFIYADRYTHQKNIILYNNQTEYYMDNFRKKLWWEYGHQLDYSIKIVHNIEQEIAQSLKKILKQNS